ncbi:MAG: TonB-dependent receptor plug domain-containing protein, partial [Gammaproteobacteria bacterium]|nr:TonB-dependent receptor plug domain-containing protein [Gammaproteobacteria bacterium]
MNKKKISLVIQAALLGSITFSTQFLSAQEKEDATQEKGVISTETTEVQAEGSKINSANEVVDSDDNNKITVTGTRIKRDSFSMATPIVTLDRDSIDDSGLGSLAEILYESVPGLTTESSSTRSQSSVSTTGLSTIALRKLGTDRTLTLIDGRRTVSNSYSGNYISLSTIPSGMVKKVEIITGGASAIYGSDAVAGVVNIITQTDREGFKARTRYGETTDGGGEEFSLDLSYGTTFNNDRGYMYAALTKDKEFGIKGTQRKNSSTYDSYLYDDDEMCNTMMTADGRQCMRDITRDDWSNLSDGMLGGVFLESSRNYEQFWYDETGTLRNDWAGNEERYGYKYNQWTMIKVPEEALVAAIKVDYDFTTNTQGYFQFQHSKNESVNTKSPEDEYEGADVIIIDPVTGLPDEVRPGYIPIDNPFVPDEIRNSNSDNGGPYRDRIYWDRRFGEVG